MNSHPLDAFTDHLINLQLTRLAWLERAGPIAKQLNEASKRDGAEDRNSAPTNQ